MSTLQFRCNSAVELATHVIPEFYTFTLLLNGGSGATETPQIGETLMLNLSSPELLAEPMRLEVKVVFRFESSNLKSWFAVAVSSEQSALLHHLRYLCRHHTSEYGKLFHRLVNDFCHSY